MNILQMVSQIRQNPNQLSQLLYQKGKINQEQFSALQGKSPSEMGEYLLNNNILPANQFNQLKSMVNNHDYK